MKIQMPETSFGVNLVSVSYRVDGSERARTQTAAREQGVDASARQRRLVWGSGATLGVHGQFADGELADGEVADRQLADRTVRRQDSSSTGQFADRTVRR